jgi:hypothetical protein
MNLELQVRLGCRYKWEHLAFNISGMIHAGCHPRTTEKSKGVGWVEDRQNGD